jgi:CheY-specific phosphatase CheX
MSEKESDQENGISQRLLQCLQVSVIETLSTMAMIEALLVDTKVSKEFTCSMEVGGLIYLTGTHEGMVGISGGRGVMSELVSQTIGLPVEELGDEDIMDGICELVNMISGGMKSKAELPAPALLSPPIAILGTGCQTIWKTSQPTNVITFQTDAGVFQVHASI